MIKIILLLMLPLFLFASKILNYNVYDRTDRTDIMITFNTPFQGVIKEKSTASKIVLTLSDVSIEAPKLKKISSKFIRTLSIIPLNNSTQIVASIANSRVHLSASKTTDGYGLRLRFSLKKTTPKETTEQEPQNSLSSLPTEKNGIAISTNYYIVVGIMIIVLFILVYFKKKIQANPIVPKKTKKASWLFESTNKAQKKSKMIQEDENKSVAIRFQKVIDEENNIVMLDFGPQSYLILMGKSNILLDKFTDEKPSSEQEFESILQSRNEELESFLSTTSSTLKRTIKEKNQEPLQAYKEKAATLRYNNSE